jgi:hypothetical protein
MPVAKRLLGHAVGDRIFRATFASHKLWAGDRRVRPSGLDAAASTIARTLIDKKVPAVALAFPRGRGSHPAMLGLTLALWRHGLPDRLSGSVVISTPHGGMSKQLRSLVFDAAEFSEMAVGRIVTENVPGTGGFDLSGNARPPKKRAAMRPLDRSGRRRLSQADGYLLFARPNTLPQLADNVVSMMVVDTVGTAGPSLVPPSDGEPDSWTRTWESNLAAHRGQLWIGELCDADFERFCADRHIPLISFDWPLIEQLVKGGNGGGGPLTTARLSARALQRPSVAYRIVEDEERDYLAREAYTLLGKLRKRGHDEHEPAVARTAWKLCGLLCRLACTKDAYDLAAGGDHFAEPIERMWKTIDNTKSSAFVGNRWKSAHRRYWDPIRSAVRKLIRLQENEATCSKYEALVERIGEAQQANERLYVICQTNAERAAVKAVLHEFGVDEGQVTVHSFGARREHDPDANAVTLLLAPPPPWRISILVSGEIGRIEILCYRHELARLRARHAESERSHEQANADALDRLHVGSPTEIGDHEAPPKLQELPGYAVRDASAPEDEFSKDIPPPDSTLWQELLAQYGEELPNGADGGADGDFEGAPMTPYSGHARLVRFTDAPPVFFRDDAELDVLLDDEDADSLTIAVPVDELETGMSIAFLPGGQRSILNVLLDTYDERHSLEAKMFEPLWERALSAAIAAHGADGIASLTERSRAAVTAWVTGRNIPQQSWRFKKVLEAAGDEEALRSQTPLWNYLTATRGPHRQIGKLNRLAIAEAARDDEKQVHLDELERYLGRDLEDLYDQVEQVTVQSVSAPATVPLADCGRFLADDDPNIRSSS